MEVEAWRRGAEEKEGRGRCVIAGVRCATLAHTALAHTRTRTHLHSHTHSTILGIAGDDFAVIASDTRLSEGYSIFSRDCPKVYEL